jgi:hypothetical protein
MAALVTGVHLNTNLPAPAQVSIQGGRLIEMQQSLLVLDRGGPPLLGGSLAAVPGLSKTSIKGVHGLYAVGTGDDQGMYLYVPLVAHYFGISDPRAALRDMYLTLAILLAFVYPLLFFEISGSLAVAVLAPIGLLFVLTRAITLIDVYWAPALVLLLGLPLLLALRARAPFVITGGVAVVCLLASISDSVRADTGVGLFIAALVVIFRWLVGWKRRAIAVGVGLLAFASVYPLALDGARAYRDSQVDVSLSSGNSHAFWHPAYLGLGYIQPNRFGIEFDDPLGWATAIVYNPHVQYLSPEYNADLEHAFARITADDPGYVLADYAEKAGDVVGGAVRLYWPELTLLAVLLLFWPPDRRWQEMMVIAAPVLIVTGLPPIFAIPLDEYELPWWAMTGICAGLALSGPIASEVDGFVRAVRAGQGFGAQALTLRHRPAASASRPLLLVCLAIALVGAVTLDHDSRIWDARTVYGTDATPTQATSVLDLATADISWDFDEQALKTWTLYPGVVAVPSPHQSRVRTGTSDYGYQMASPSVALAAGNYILAIRGTVHSGGLSAGLLDVTHNVWLGGSVGDFWYGQPQGKGLVMTVNITATADAKVQVVLSNLAPEGGSSVWDLSSVTIFREK